MRLDKFLKLTQLIKRRTVANETADEGNIFVNNKKVKPSYTIKVGDEIKIDLWNYLKRVKVLALPVSPNIKKDDIGKYIEEVEYTPKRDGVLP